MQKKYKPGTILFEAANDALRTRTEHHVVLECAQTYAFEIVGGGGGANATHVGDGWWRATGSSGAMAKGTFKTNRQNMIFKVFLGGFGTRYYAAYQSGYPYNEQCYGLTSYIDVFSADSQQGANFCAAAGGNAPNGSGGTVSVFGAHFIVSSNPDNWTWQPYEARHQGGDFFFSDGSGIKDLNMTGSRDSNPGAAAYGAYVQPWAAPALSVWDNTATGWGAGAGVGYGYDKAPRGGYCKIWAL